MHAARLSGCGGARWGRGGVTAAKGRWSWAVRWVKFTVKQQVVLEDKRRGWGGWSSSVLLRVQLSLAAAHGSDEGGPLTAAVLR